MAAGTFLFYDATAKSLLAGGDLTGGSVKLALVGAGYTPNQDSDNEWADVVPASNEIAQQGGYTTGGFTLQTPVVTEITQGFKFSSENIQQTATGADIPTWKWGVMYISGTVEGVVNPLIGYFQGETSGGGTVPATTQGNPLTITCPANGWFDLTRPA